MKGTCQISKDQKIIKNKVGLLKLAETLGSVSEACKVLGYSPGQLYASANCCD
jgi:molybdenum-dependent DNA-binding transcriptional regulator ModE